MTPEQIAYLLYMLGSVCFFVGTLIVYIRSLA